MNDKLNIDELFNDILEDELQKKRRMSRLEEIEFNRLNIVHQINESNIDYIYDQLINDKNNPFYKGRWFCSREIIDATPVKKDNRIWYNCRCKCGKEILTRADRLLSDYGLSGCNICLKPINTKRLNDYSNTEAQIGQIFGKRTVTEIIGRNGNNEFKVLCRCECGHIGPVRYAILKRGKSHACAKCTKPGPQPKKYKRES